MKEKMSVKLRTRIHDVMELKNKGKKIVGYIPNGYIPDELVYACDAIPLPLIHGGEFAPVIASTKCLLRFLDTFCRAQIGYRILKQETLYQIIDVLIVPVTDNHVRAIADSWDFYTDVEVVRFGVPHAKTHHGLTYYLEGLRLVKEKLEQLTGNDIKDQRLRQEIELSNTMRNLLRKISLMRMSEHPPLRGKDFIELNHACLLGDRHIMVEILKSVYKELKEKKVPILKGPRILLIGSTMALGDYKIHDLIEETGASIVIEEFCEGTKKYWENVKTNGDVIRALADSYFMRSVPGAFFRGSYKERFDYLLKLITDFKVNGVVWYSLMYRDAYDVEGYLFGRMMDKLKVPFLKVSSDYNDSEIGALRTRIETFIEVIERR
jgi:benzoyl-CoA reductase/2-hydroxyglutaryl-CoA dehydratase subunit BcrC/BadD/HgdB